MHGVWLSFSASQHIRFRNFIDQWHHLNVFDSQKIRVIEILLHISKKSEVKTQIVSTPWRAIDDKITLAPVLLCKPTPHSRAAYHQRKVHPTRPWPIAVRTQSAARRGYALATDLTRKFAFAINKEIAAPNRQAKSHRATSQRVRDTELHRHSKNNRDT